MTSLLIVGHQHCDQIPILFGVVLISKIFRMILLFVINPSILQKRISSSSYHMQDNSSWYQVT